MFFKNSQPETLPCNRRTLLGMGLAGAGSIALAANPFARLLAREAEDAGLKLGVQLYSLRGFSTEEALKYAKELGFIEVEFFDRMFPLTSSDDAIAKMVSQVKSLDLKISAHGVNPFTKDDAANRKIFEFAKKAGIKNISAAPTPDSFDSLDALVKEFDIRIAIHNHGPSDRFNKAVDVLRAIEGRDPRIGACADLGHYIRSGEKPVEVIRTLAGRLYGIHLKDFAEMKENTRGVILGKGHLDCAAVFDALIQAKFPSDGALSLEYEENEKNPIADMRECYAVANDALTRVRSTIRTD